MKNRLEEHEHILIVGHDAKMELGEFAFDRQVEEKFPIQPTHIEGQMMLDDGCAARSIGSEILRVSRNQSQGKETRTRAKELTLR